MHHHRLIKAWWLALVFAMCSTASVGAFPPLPSSFYGTVQQEGKNIPDGTLVEALIDGKVMAYSHSETYQGTSVFSLDVPGDESATDIIEGGTSGQRIEFRVGGMLADQSTQWTSGVNENIDLTLPAGQVFSPTIPSFTPVPSQTPIPIGTHTPNVTQRPTYISGDEESTIEIILTDTQIPLSTQTENQTNLEDQPEYGLNAIDENGDSLGPSLKRSFMAVSSNDVEKAAADLVAVTVYADQETSIKDYSALWIGLSLLMLICLVVIVLVVRRKYRKQMDSSDL